MDTEGIVKATARLALGAGAAWERKWRFLGLFLIVFFASFALLANLGLTPDPSQAVASPLVSGPPLASLLSTDAAAAPILSTASGETPVKIEIPAIKLSAFVTNPSTTDINALDTALLSGAVRYPTSAKLGQDGNVVIFGHSSYLPIVNNQAYKTFNGIQKLTPGAMITVYSSDAVYTYAVESVVKADANSGTIPLTVSGKELTLSTCDSFGAKSDRFIVTASFVESHAISS